MHLSSHTLQSVTPSLRITFRSEFHIIASSRQLHHSITTEHVQRAINYRSITNRKLYHSLRHRHRTRVSNTSRNCKLLLPIQSSASPPSSIALIALFAYTSTANAFCLTPHILILQTLTPAVLVCALHHLWILRSSPPSRYLCPSSQAHRNSCKTSDK